MIKHVSAFLICTVFFSNLFCACICSWCEHMVWINWRVFDHYRFSMAFFIQCFFQFYVLNISLPLQILVSIFPLTFPAHGFSLCVVFSVHT